jgi:perosamine synthetase
MNEFIPVSRPHLTKKEEEYVLDAVRSGWVSSIGKYVDAFESRFAQYCGVKYALTTSNGTTGLHLALVAAGIGPGDEVIVPDFTFVATANAVSYTGAKPVFVDIDADTLCIDPGAVRAAVTPKTRAIVPVHLYGHPADMDELEAIAAQHKIPIIEDAAEAHGAEYKGKRVGGFGKAGVFSFYGNKIITTGEGGMITTNDADFYKKARHLRDQAMSSEKRYWHNEIGFNYRLTNMQAALGLAQMDLIDEMLHRRGEILAQYRDVIQISGSVRLNHTANWAKSAYWMICLEADQFDDAKRAIFMQRLKDRGIDSRPYFYPITMMPMYKQPTPAKVAAKSAIGLNLPTYHELSREDVERIGRAVNEELHALGCR